MSKWRIKIVRCNNEERYILQKRLFGFLWWFNPDNIDGCITGVYDTLDDAIESYKRKTATTDAAYIAI